MMPPFLTRAWELLALAGATELSPLTRMALVSFSARRRFMGLPRDCSPVRGFEAAWIMGSVRILCPQPLPSTLDLRAGGTSALEAFD